MQQRGWRRAFTGLVVALAALAVPAVAKAQTGKITGIVTDAATGQPIEGVQVIVQGTGLGTVTQPNGRYFILAVRPGTYTVTARRIGYQSQEQVGVSVAIDQTREVSFRLSSSSTTLQTQRIVADATPLIPRGQTSSSTSITAETIQSLPVTDIAGVLALQQGFTLTPQNTGVVSAAEEQRSTVAPIRVRGGRGGSTVTLIDGIPINNPLFGTSAIDLNPLAVSGLSFDRGYMEPQYGNGLSGVINQSLWEGGDELQGSLDYQTSSVSGALGSRPDELLASNILRGRFSGPVPGTASRLRYAISGQLQSAAASVFEFDQDVFSYDRNQTFPGLAPSPLDLVPGWSAFGGRSQRQIVGKLTFLPTATTRINAYGLSDERQVQRYDRRYLNAYRGDPLQNVGTQVDSLGLIRAGFANRLPVIFPSIRDEGRVYGASIEQRFGRTQGQLRAARTEFGRNTCNFFQGVCVPTQFYNGNFDGTFIAPFAQARTRDGYPFGGSGFSYGGEDYSTWTFRGDLQSQVTDHHQLQGGVQFIRHDIEYTEVRGIQGNSGPAGTVNQLFRAKPTEFATYIQDRIEYDFLTVKIGARFNYSKAAGSGFTDPYNPTNGTTAREVCNGDIAGISRFTTRTTEGVDLSGAAACLYQRTPGVRSPLLDSAARLAQFDDFTAAKARSAVEPRIGVSFPLTERSALFFNAGRYTMVPMYSFLYRNSGVGVTAGLGAGTDNFCAEGEVKPGTTECAPPLVAGLPDFVGNPNLNLEEATQYEIGYGAEFGRNYSVNVAVYNRDESGLSGLQASRTLQDIGGTYSGQQNPNYQVITNQDFLTSRGMELQFRRRVANNWGYDLNYGWARTTTNSPPPDRSFEIDQGGEIDRTARREILSDIDQTHRFNAQVQYVVRTQPPAIRWVGPFLRNTTTSLTYSYVSGLPYTPSRGNTLGAVQTAALFGAPNSARGPATQTVNALFQKNFRIQNLGYGAFVRVENLLDRKNCIQVYINTGNCDSGTRDYTNRRVGNSNEDGLSSTDYDQPEYIGTRRQIFTGLSINF